MTIDPEKIFPVTEEEQTRFLQTCRKGTRVAVSFTALDGRGWGHGVWDRQGEVTWLDRKRTWGTIRVKLKGFHHDFLLPTPPLDQNPVILRLRRVQDNTLLVHLMSILPGLNVVSARAVHASLRTAMARDSYDAWAADFTQFSGIQLVHDPVMLERSVGDLSKAAQSTHDHIVNAVASLRAFLSARPDDDISILPLVGLVQRLLDDWSVRRLRHFNCSVNTFTKAILKDPDACRETAFDKAFATPYQAEKVRPPKTKCPRALPSPSPQLPLEGTAAAAAAAEAAAAEAAGAPAGNPRAGVSCEHCRVLEGRQRRWRRYPRPLRVGTRVPAPKSVMTRCMCPLPPDSTPPVVMESPSAMRTDGASAETAAASAVESCASSTSSTKPAPDSTDPGELCLGAGQPGLGGSREEVGSPDAGNGAVSAAPSPPPPAAMRPSSSVEATLYGTCSVGSENGTGYVTSDGPSHAGNLPCQDLPTAPEALNAGGRVAACCTSLGGDLAGQVSPTAPVSRAATGLAAEGFGVSDGPRLRPAFPSDPLARRMAAGPPSSPRDDDEPPGPYDDPYEPIVETDSGGVIHIRAPGSGRRIRPRDAARVSPESMTLAATSTNVIDVAAIEEDHPDLAPLLALTHDVRAFEALFLPDAKSDRRRPLSRGMDHHYDDLGKYDIIETNPALTSVLGLLVVAWCTFFLVPKKIKTLGRLVIDARPINQRQRRPPPMGLPRMAQVIRTILSWEVAAKCDGKSFFYQFPLAGGIARYFRARIAGRRGKVIEVILKRLPMGWSFSPAIAQAVGNALTRALGLAWVDDFIIGGSRAEFEGRRAEFLRRLRRYNIEVDDETLEAAWELFALGLEFDLRRKRYRVDPAWITKRLSRWAEIRQRIETGHATFREIFELYGALIWADYVMEQPLWMRAEALAALSAIAKRARGRYDDPVPFPEYARRNLDDWMDGVAKNPWREPVERPSISDAEDILFSDASSTGGAWIRLFKDQIVDGDQWLHEEDLHIYLREVEAMCAAAKNSHPNARTLQVVDNTAAVGTANRGHSSSYLANVIMRETYGPRKPWVIWAPTDRQLADPFTRGEPIPTLPHPLLPQHRQVIASLDAQGQPDSKRKQPDQLHVISSFLDDTGTIRAR